ncbi:hypothetical protein GOODEAATRI_017424 [Goodea atripinnis]|uniref:Uncharacterized protein n=1 Tax=Goodea atripinnis TaxID=208336 RepID=A0ABV0P5N4_9TELE
MKMFGALFYLLKVVPNKVPHPSSAHSHKASLLHQLSNLLPPRVLLSPVLRQRLTKALQPNPEPQVRVLLSEVREVPLKLRDSSLSPSSRNLLVGVLARNLLVGSNSTRNLPHSLGSNRRVDHSRRSSQAVPGHQPPSSRDLPLKHT